MILEERYLHPDMARVVTREHRFLTMRGVWYSQLEALSQVMDLPPEIDPMKILDVPYDEEAIQKLEKELKHETFAYLAYINSCVPEAAHYLHFGCTSEDILDMAHNVNTWHVLRSLIQDKTIALSRRLNNKTTYSNIKKDDAVINGYTHGQPADPITWSHRYEMWDTLLTQAFACYEDSQVVYARGVRGPVGTSKTLTDLLGPEKALKFNKAFCAHFAFSYDEHGTYGQTGSRVHSHMLINGLATIAAVCHKIATDIRLLSAFGEVTGSRTDKQIGSSAMPNKINPIQSERICGLSRYVMSLPQNTLNTLATQWLERSLDDSSNNRIVIEHAHAVLYTVLDDLHKLLLTLNLNIGKSTQLVEDNIANNTAEIFAMAMKAGISRNKTYFELKRCYTAGTKPIDDPWFQTNIWKTNG